ncbi:MAG: PAS domain-containing protein [Alphaproteobacteria bacterium]|nr:PAS domain-containing protein [Alphaproteobacteria bacterium]
MDGYSAGAQEFLDHWRSLPRVGLVPHIRDYLDRVAAPLQPNVLILDVVSESRLEVRLFGTRLADLTGQEITRTNVLENYPEELRAEVGLACVTMVKRPCGQVSTRAIRTSGGSLVAGSSIALPILVDRQIPGAVVAYTELRDTIDADGLMIMVQMISNRQWVDIGAGVPPA